MRIQHLGVQALDLKIRVRGHGVGIGILKGGARVVDVAVPCDDGDRLAVGERLGCRVEGGKGVARGLQRCVVGVDEGFGDCDCCQPANGSDGRERDGPLEATLVWTSMGREVSIVKRSALQHEGSETDAQRKFRTRRCQACMTSSRQTALIGPAPPHVYLVSIAERWLLRYPGRSHGLHVGFSSIRLVLIFYS